MWTPWRKTSEVFQKSFWGFENETSEGKANNFWSSKKKLQKLFRLWLGSPLWKLWGAPLEVRVGSPGFWILPWGIPKWADSGFWIGSHQKPWILPWGTPKKLRIRSSGCVGLLTKKQRLSITVTMPLESQPPINVCPKMVWGCTSLTSPNQCGAIVSNMAVLPCWLILVGGWKCT